MITLLLLSINLACNKAATEPPLDTGEKTQANVDKTRSEAILTDVSQQQPETPINAISWQWKKRKRQEPRSRSWLRWAPR